MARVFMDGFESGNTDLWDIVVAMPISTKAGKQGNYCAGTVGGGNMYMTKNLPASSEYYLAVKICPQSHVTGSFIYFGGPTANIGYYDISHGNVYSGVNGGGNTLLGYAYAIPESTGWYLVEFYYKVADSGGRAVVKINGDTKFDFTGDTKYGSDTTITSLTLQCYNGEAYWDDIILDDANWIGSSTIQAIALSGGGATTQWDPSAGNNYACVDDIPASDADYVSTNVSGEVDTYQCADLTGTINSVKSVQVQFRCMKEGASGPTQLYPVIRPASTDRLGTIKTPNTFTPKSFSHVWTNNPEDSQAWEASDVNAIEIGMKVVS